MPSNRPKTLQLAFAYLLACTSLVLGQHVALKGNIQDACNHLPIDAGAVVVRDKPIGTSNTDGQYRVEGLQPRKVKVIYRAAGYGARPYDVSLISPETTQLAELFRDTNDGPYWDHCSAGFRDAVQRQTNDPGVQSTLYAQHWEAIEASSLSPVVKVSAARYLGDVMPPGVRPPQGLLAYRQVDNKLIEAAQSKFYVVLRGDGSLRNVHFDIPGTVAADVAAKQVGEQIKKVGKQYMVPKDFMGDFQVMWGADVTNRFKTMVATETAILKDNQM
jgi:hypothetical protein